MYKRNSFSGETFVSPSYIYDDDICKSQLNPETNTNFTDCGERNNLYCTTVMTEYANDEKIKKSIKEVGCVGYRKYLEKERCKKELENKKTGITDSIDPDQYCNEYSCSTAIDTSNDYFPIYNDTSVVLPCTQTTEYKETNDVEHLGTQSLGVIISTNKANDYFPRFATLTRKDNKTSVPRVIVNKIEDKIPGFSNMGQGQGFIQDPRIEKYVGDDVDVELSDQQIDALNTYCNDNPGQKLAPLIMCPGEETTKQNSKLGIILGASIGGSILLALILYFVISRRRRMN
tara:strand:- start:190 stop:1053 length:864 start_codon:yes stop_codon:yes gene_type:complete